MMLVSATVKITNANPSPGQAFSDSSVDILLMPAWMDGNDGVYAEQSVALSKELRQSGVTLSWIQEAENRQWYGERSAVVDLLAVPFVVGILSTAGWEAIKLLFSKKSGRAKVKIGWRKYSDGVIEEHWLELEGSPGDISQTLEELNPWRQAQQPQVEGENE